MPVIWLPDNVKLLSENRPRRSVIMSPLGPIATVKPQSYGPEELGETSRDKSIDSSPSEASGSAAIVLRLKLGVNVSAASVSEVF
jgi:hypothetical protein